MTLPIKKPQEEIPFQDSYWDKARQEQQVPIFVQPSKQGALSRKPGQQRFRRQLRCQYELAQISMRLGLCKKAGMPRHSEAQRKRCTRRISRRRNQTVENKEGGAYL